ncbi:Probable tRNA sulfurtransferase [Geodia barretti]|uniref:Probable tRNA sulfurtransferase n=4 Tax=Geodia barretti TaxID=519541 RepID=A0AA35R5J5_GEOBA|nr:Probable tRNA sulfurtransferase [Geodia barretti]
MTNNQFMLIHYHEIGLKGKNRGRFERRLMTNITRALKDVPCGKLERLSGRMMLALTSESPIDVIRERLSTVFGIANFSEAVVAKRNIEAIRETTWALAQKADFESFKIVTKRGDKTFPLNSDQINRDVGKHIQTLSGARVLMDNPDLICFIEIAPQRIFIYAEKIPAPGGLPVGSNERAVSLLSSGIDSPVASYKIMKRGVKLTYVHFHSQPYTNRNSQRNTEDLVRLLTRHQYVSDLYLVPFVEIQRHIMTRAPASYRVILYRRAMLRIAEAIAQKVDAHALVTGENVGQVASQTLSNMRAIEEVTPLPILRPLSGDNKEEIINEARRIGTYQISIEPYEDCCSVFVPKHPETRANLEKVREIESALDLAPLIIQTLEQTKRKTFKF